MSTILADWQPHHVSLFGEHILHLKHRLAESALFSDAALAKLIENTPPAHLYVNTMDRRSHNPRSRREGAIDGLFRPVILGQGGAGSHDEEDRAAEAQSAQATDRLRRRPEGARQRARHPGLRARPVRRRCSRWRTRK